MWVFAGSYSLMKMRSPTTVPGWRAITARAMATWRSTLVTDHPMSPGDGAAVFSCQEIADHTTWCAAEYARKVSRSNSCGLPGAHWSALRLGPITCACGSTDLMACHATT